MSECLWRLAYKLAGECGLTDLSFQVPPRCFLALNSGEARPRTLAWLKELWSVLETLEATATEDKDAHQFLQGLLWPLEQWSREVLISLVEADWDWGQVASWLSADLQAYSQAHFSSLMCENLGNAITQGL